MTTANAPDDATAAERTKLIRTYRTRAYLSRGRAHPAGRCSSPAMPALQRRPRRADHGLEATPEVLSRSQIRVGLSLRSERISRISREDSSGVYKSALSEDSIGRSMRSIAECGRVKHRAIRASSPPDAGKPLRCTPATRAS